jgi:hypothetical protein
VFRTFFTYPVELRRSLRVAALRGDFLVGRMTAADDIDTAMHSARRWAAMCTAQVLRFP